MKKIKLFACLLYEDSMAGNWFEKASRYGIPFYFVFHDKDDKKPHYHVFFTAINGISPNTAQEIVIAIGGANKEVLKVASKRGYLRYLTHMDNPEKHQYDVSEVHTGCGAVYDNEAIMDEKELQLLSIGIMRDMVEYIDNNNVYLYCDFVRYCLDCKPAWFNVLVSSRGRVIDKYIKSLHWAHYNCLR